MKVYTEPVTCEVCGGEGMARAGDAKYDWVGGLRHSNPEICAENLRRQRRKLEADRKKLEEQKCTCQ